MTVEKDVEQYLKKRVENLGGKCMKLPATYEEGIPDRLVIVPNGCIMFVELKRPKGGVLSDVQKYQHKKLRNLGCRVYVLKNKAEIDDFIKEIIPMTQQCDTCANKDTEICKTCIYGNEKFNKSHYVPKPCCGPDGCEINWDEV